MEKRWDEEGVKEGDVGVIKKEAKWMRRRRGLKSVVFDLDFGVVNRRSCGNEVCRFLFWGKVQR